MRILMVLTNSFVVYAADSDIDFWNKHNPTREQELKLNELFEANPMRAVRQAMEEVLK